MKLGILASHPIQYHAPLFRELARQCDVRIFFAHRQTAQAQADAGFGVAFEWDADMVGGYSHTFLGNVAANPDATAFWGCNTPAIAHEIEQGGFDAFVVMGWYLRSYWQAVRACHQHGVPVLVRGDSQLRTQRNPAKTLAKAWVYPLLLRQFDGYLYVGQRNRDYLEHYGAAGERLFFSPHCVDNDWFSGRAARVDREEARARLAITPDQSCVLFVGKLVERKNPLDLVRALRLLLDRGRPVVGVVAGDGVMRQEMEAEGKTLGVPLRFLGFRNQSSLPEVYAAADVMALPSDGSETWGLVVNESLACGTPVVVSDAAGCAPDLAIEGSSGCVYPVGDIPALAAALEQVLASPPPRSRIAQVIGAHSVEASARGVMEGARAITALRATRPLERH